MRPFVLILCLVVLGACSLPRGAALQSEVTAASTNKNADFAVYAVTRESLPTFANWPKWHGYTSWVGRTRGPTSPVIASGDTLDLIIWDNSDNSLLLQPGAKVVDMQGISVGPDGSVFIPYLDKIYVKGLTPDAARKLIQTRLAVIVPSAQVQLNYNPGSSSTVSLVAGVGAPGDYPLPDRNFSILRLISLGGGVPPGMRNPQVKLVRGGKNYQTSLSLLYDDPKLDVILRGGDKVIIEEDDRFFQALGSTGREDIIHFTKQQITALEAMSIVGGINDSRADPKGILILREYASTHVRSDGKGPSHTDVVFTVDLTSADGLFSAKRFYIQPDDVVLVTESPVTKAQTIFGLIGSAFGLVSSAQSLSN